jgi:hypothetical protein
MNDEMDKLLAQLKAEYQEQQQPQPKAIERSRPNSAKPKSPLQAEDRPQTFLDHLLAEVSNEFQQPKLSQENNLKSKSSSPLSSQSATKQELIEQLQQEYQAKEKIEQEQKEQKKKEALKQKAQQWLKELDPKSDEGLWFEEFAYSYESKLAAAIDYLSALRETRFLG